MQTHGRRRFTSGVCGASTKDILAHLIAKIPELSTEKLDRTTIARLFNPPIRGTIAAKAYHGMVDARVAHKNNCDRKSHIDVHFDFSQVRIADELAAAYSEEVCWTTKQKIR